MEAHAAQDNSLTAHSSATTGAVDTPAPPAPPPPPDDHQTLAAAVAAGAAAGAAASGEQGEGDSGDHDGDGDDEEVQVLERRKFFPRIKVLLSEEYADFLKSVIEALEASNCASFSTSTSDTPWLNAFDVIYGTIAREFSVPVGKNRLHKFKTKMVELWTAMDREVKLGHSSIADPVYKMALKQWEIHQSVKDRPRSQEKTVIVRIGGDDGSDGGGEVEATNPFNGGGAVGQAHQQHQALPSAESGGTVPRLPKKSRNNITIPDDLADSLRHSVSRLEHMLAYSGLVPPKLPSPLNELVRIKDQMEHSEFRRLVEPTYEREVIRHLEVVMTQAHNSAHPGLLPSILDGVDTLKRIPGHRQAIVRSIDRAYTSILKIYINLLGAASAPAGALVASPITSTTTAAAAESGGRKAPPPPSLSEEDPLPKRQKTNSDAEDNDEDGQNDSTNHHYGEDLTKLQGTSV